MNSPLQLLKDLPQTFYSQGFYRSLFTSRDGIGLGYLLVVTLVGILSLAIVAIPAVRPLVEETVAMFDQLPEVTIENGQLSVVGTTPQSFTLMAKEEGGPITIMIDPAETMDDSQALTTKMHNEKILILAGKNSAAIYDAAKKAVKIQRYDETKNVTVTHDDWVRFGANLNMLLAPIMLISIGMMIFLMHLFTAFLGGLLILIIAPLFRVQANLASSMRLASAAKVPVAAVFAIATPHLPLQALVWFGFAAFGLLGVKKGVSTEEKG